MVVMLSLGETRAGDFFAADQLESGQIAAVTIESTSDFYGASEYDASGYAVAPKGGPIYCFPAGTEVLMADGSTKPIEEVEEGDLVLADDPEDSASPTGYKVAGTLDSATYRLIEIGVSLGGGNTTLKATGEHPFWTSNRGWQNAEDLEVGDSLVTSQGKERLVVSVETHYLEKTATYNLSVAGVKTFYVLVGGEAVLVHNTEIPIRPEDITTGPHGPDRPMIDVKARALGTRTPQGRWVSASGAQASVSNLALNGMPPGVGFSHSIQPGSGVVVQPYTSYPSGATGTMLLEADGAVVVNKRVGGVHTYPTSSLQYPPPITKGGVAPTVCP